MFTKNLVGGGQAKEYIIKLDTAKEMALLERNENIVKDIRRYTEQLGQSNIALSDFFTKSTHKGSKGEIRPCYRRRRLYDNFIKKYWWSSEEYIIKLDSAKEMELFCHCFAESCIF